MRDKRTPQEERRQLLADDLRRIAGFASAVVGEAIELGLDIPEEVPGCVATLAGWSRLLRGERADQVGGWRVVGQQGAPVGPVLSPPTRAPSDTSLHR